MTTRIPRISAPALVVILAILVPCYAGAAGWQEGAFAGSGTEPGHPGVTTLTAGTPFPQVSRTREIPLAADTEVRLATNVRFRVSASWGDSPSGAVIRGRATVHYAEIEGETRVWAMGSFDLYLAGDAPGALPDVSGPLAGDGHAIYLAGRAAAPGVGIPPVWLLRLEPERSDDLDVGLVVRDPASGELRIGDTLAGRLRVTFGRQELRRIADDLVAPQVVGPIPHKVVGLTTGTTVVNQVTREEFVIPLDDGGPYTVPGLRNQGALTGTGSNPFPAEFNSDFTGFMVSGGTLLGRGLAMSHFTISGAAGRSEGLMVGDLGPYDGLVVGSPEPVKGYLFSLAGEGTLTGMLFGTYEGTYGRANNIYDLNASINASLYRGDEVPPEIPGGLGDAVSVTAGARWMPTTTVRDLNGWADTRVVELAVGGIGDARSVRARYRPAVNRLQVWNPAVGAWTTGCRPGEAMTLRGGTARLSCLATTVGGWGEHLTVSWALVPSPAMIGTRRVRARAIDRSGFVEGWRWVGTAVIE